MLLLTSGLRMNSGRCTVFRIGSARATVPIEFFEGPNEFHGGSRHSRFNLDRIVTICREGELAEY